MKDNKLKTIFGVLVIQLFKKSKLNIKPILFLLSIIPTICLGQNISQDGLWKGYTVKDKEGNEIRYKRQDFVKIKGDSILLFQFKEKMSMETGEISILTVVDTLTLGQNNLDQVYPLSHNDKSLSLEMRGENEFQIIYPEIILTFKKIIALQESTISFSEVQDFILGSTIVQTDPITKKPADNLSKTYQANGKVKYKEMDSRSNWESAFKVIYFEGFVFLKGITSAPTILTKIENEILSGLEVDFRFKPKLVNLIDLNNLNELDSDASSAVLPFEIKITETSPQECISQLSDAQLNLEVSLAKGITERQVATVQVQHSYKCGWMLFHEEDFDGFAKATVKDLLEIDPSLCYIIDIPCAYYAERETKNDSWYIYLHEERIETDSSYITKKAFRWNNTYRVINELKNQDITHYVDYHLDSRLLKKTWTSLAGKEIGTIRFYDINGKLEKETKNHK